MAQLSKEAIEGFSIRQALETASKYTNDNGLFPAPGQAVGLSTCRWDPHYSPAAVVSAALSSEVSEDVRHLFHQGAGSFFLPLPSDLTRAAITQGNTGAQLVGNGLQTIVDALRPAPLLDALGVRIVPVSSGSAHVAGMADQATYAWFSDGSGPASPAIGSTIGNTHKAKTLITVTEVSRQTLLQTSDQAEALLLNDLMRGIRAGLETAVFQGSGSSGQPTGVLNVTGANSTAYAGSSPTRAELLSQLDDLADDGVDITQVQFAVHPTMAVLLHSVVDGASRPIYDGRTMLGLPVRVSTNVPAGKVLAGDWSQLVLVTWGRLEVSRAQSVRPDFCERFRVVALADVAIPRPQAFSVGSAP